MPLDAISATLLTTAALMFVALIRRVKAGLWPRARREIRRRWFAGLKQSDGLVAQGLPRVHRQALSILREAAPTAKIQARVALNRLVTPAAHETRAGQSQTPAPCIDLLITDSRTNKRLAVLIETLGSSERRRHRLELTRERLFSRGIAVSVWRQAALPSAAVARQLLSQAGIAVGSSESSSGSRSRESRRPSFDGQTQPSTLI